MTRYTTRDEAVEYEVRGPLGDEAADHDVEAIAARALGSHSQGYACQVSSGEFWEIVADYRLCRVSWCERSAEPGHLMHQTTIGTGNGWAVEVAQLEAGDVTVAPVLGSDVQDLAPADAVEFAAALARAAVRAAQLAR